VHVDAHIGHDAHIQELAMFNASPAHTHASTPCNTCKHELKCVQLWA